jgi:hypothetical protein
MRDRSFNDCNDFVYFAQRYWAGRLKYPAAKKPSMTGLAEHIFLVHWLTPMPLI